MDDWDVPKFTETEIKFNGVIYKINIESNGCCEFTNSHRIMYWNWQVEPVKKQ